MSQPQVLLVEDEPDLLRALSVRLASIGLSCATACNGLDALAKVRAQRPDLIVTDLIMPEMDGYALCRSLHADSRTASIPVVVLTAVPRRALAQEAEGLHVARVVHKPFDSSEFLSTVQDVLAAAPQGGLPHG